MYLNTAKVKLILNYLSYPMTYARPTPPAAECYYSRIKTQNAPVN